MYRQADGHTRTRARTVTHPAVLYEWNMALDDTGNHGNEVSDFIHPDRSRKGPRHTTQDCF